jgi:ABC-type Fe3+ transport system permease subunit
LVDRGPHGEARITAFHLVLALSDHAASDAIRNSLILAAIVSAASMAIGLSLSALVTNKEFPGRDALISLVRMPGVIPPLFAALGLSGLMRLLPESLDSSGRWLALAWVELAWGVPRVMDAALLAFSKTPTAWEDAARLAGAGRRRAWWATVWPMGRHRVMRAVAEVFVAVLFEPGGPLALGVRATLPFQIVSDALASDRLGRAASLGLIGLIAASVARRLILWRRPPSWPDFETEAPRGSRRVPWMIKMWTVVAFAGWIAFAAIPAVVLMASAVGLDRAGRGTVSAFSDLTTGPALPMLAHGLILGLSASLVAALMAGASDQSANRALRPGGLPPLAIGLAAMLLPTLIDAASVSVGGGSGRMLHRLADSLDPYFAPWTLLIAAGAMLRFPEMSDALARVRSSDSAPRIDSARTLGATPASAWLGVEWPRWSSVVGGAFAWSVARSALDLGSTLLLAPTLAARPITPGILTLAATPHRTREAAAMATVALLIPLAAWIIAGSRPKLA